MTGGSVVVRYLGPTTIQVGVPTEDGKTCIIDIEHREQEDVYELRVSGPLIDQSTEAVTAAVQMALLSIRESRSLGASLATLWERS